VANFSSRIRSGWMLGAAPAHPNLMPETREWLRSDGANSKSKSA
jgi:hypothetical protein